VSTLIHLRRAVAFFCIAIVLLAVLPGASGLPWAVLTPVWLFVAAVVTLYVWAAFSDDVRPAAPVLSIVSGRAPPIA